MFADPRSVLFATQQAAAQQARTSGLSGLGQSLGGGIAQAFPFSRVSEYGVKFKKEPTFKEELQNEIDDWLKDI